MSNGARHDGDGSGGSARVPRHVVRHRTFVNRELPLGKAEQRLLGALEDETPGLLAFNGAQGSGKTWFANRLGCSLSETFPDGVLYYSLRDQYSGEELDAEVVAEYFLRELGVAPADVPRRAAEKFSTLRSHTQEKRLLFLFDDVSSVNQIADLLPSSRFSAVVVFSQHRLDRLTAIGFDPPEPLAGFTPDATRALLRVVGRQQVTEQDESVLRQFLDACGGLPGVLAMAASQMCASRETFGSYVASLRSGGVLERLGDDGAGVLDFGYRRLSRSLARAHRLLSLYPGAAMDVPGAARLLDEPDAEVAGYLDSLTAMNMLERLPDGRYRFLNPVREQARLRSREIDTEDVRTAAVLRAVEHRLSTFVSWDKAISNRPVVPTLEPLYDVAAPVAPKQAWACWAREWDEVAAVLSAAEALGRPDLSWKIVVAAWQYGYQTERVRSLRDWHAIARDAADRADDPYGRWQIEHQIASIHELCGEWDQATAVLESAAALAPHAHGRQTSLEWAALIQEQIGELTRARELLLAAAAAIAEMEPRHRQRAGVINGMHLGRVSSALGEFDRAWEELAAPAQYFAEQHEPFNEARCRDAIGEAAAALHELTTARREWDRAQQLFGELGMLRQRRAVVERLIEIAEDADERRRWQELRDELDE